MNVNAAVSLSHIHREAEGDAMFLIFFSTFQKPFFFFFFLEMLELLPNLAPFHICILYQSKDFPEHQNMASSLCHFRSSLTQSEMLAGSERSSEHVLTLLSC